MKAGEYFYTVRTYGEHVYISEWLVTSSQGAREAKAVKLRPNTYARLQAHGLTEPDIVRRGKYQSVPFVRPSVWTIRP